MATTKEMIEVMQAYVEGKTIECRYLNLTAERGVICEPRWDWTNYEYRVKPEQKINSEQVPDECGFYHPMKREYIKDKLYICRTNALDWVTCSCLCKDTDGFWIFQEVKNKNKFYKDWNFHAVILLDDIDLINRKFSKFNEELLNAYRNKSLDYFQKSVDLRKENEEFNNKIKQLNLTIEYLERDRNKLNNQYINEKLKCDKMAKDVETLEFYVNGNDELNKDEIKFLKDQLKTLKEQSDFYYKKWNEMTHKAIKLCGENIELKNRKSMI